jgi:hypothetical protein
MSTQIHSKIFQLYLLRNYDIIFNFSAENVCTDSSVGIATHYGLGGPGNESGWRRDYPHPSRLALRATESPKQWVPSFSSGLKRPGRGLDHQHLSSAEVKERVELYLYSPSGLSWPVLM